MKMFVLVLVFLSLGHTAFGQDFNTRLVVKLGEIMGAKPQKIEIELLSQKKLLDSYRDMLFSQCMGGRPQRFEYCAQNVDTAGTFVHGIWIREKDPNHLHIQVHVNSGMDAVIHEFCHWYLSRLSGYLNNHTILEALAGELLVSPALREWLEKEQK